MFDHSIKVPQLYKNAAKFAKEVKEKNVSLKNLVYEQKHGNIKATYSLVINVFRNLNQLELLFKKSKILEKEPRLDPWLARVLVTEMLWGKKRLIGESKPIKTVLAYQQILTAHSSDVVEDLEEVKTVFKPRYVRVNTLLISVNEVIEGFRNEGWTFVRFMDTKDYNGFLEKVFTLAPEEFMVDIHIKELLIFPPNTHFYNHNAYKNGLILLQDKASCLAVHLLDPKPESTVLDMCAAPGMKTSQIACRLENKGKIYAVDMDQKRLKTVDELIDKCGITNVTTIHKDVLNVKDNECPNVEYILVDPSCSGNGIVNRLELIKKKEAGEERIQKLFGFQVMALKHAFRHFPNAKRIVYSTCSLNMKENEEVIQEIITNCNGFKLIDAKKLMPNWLNFGSDEFGEIGTRCLYSRPEQDHCNGFFVAVFERLENGEVNEFFDSTKASIARKLYDTKLEKRNKNVEGKEISLKKKKNREKIKSQDSDRTETCLNDACEALHKLQTNSAKSNDDEFLKNEKPINKNRSVEQILTLRNDVDTKCNAKLKIFLKKGKGGKKNGSKEGSVDKDDVELKSKTNEGNKKQNASEDHYDDQFESSYHETTNNQKDEKTEYVDHSTRKEEKITKKRRSSLAEDISNKSRTAKKHKPNDLNSSNQKVLPREEEQIELIKDASSAKKKHKTKKNLDASLNTENPEFQPEETGDNLNIEVVEKKKTREQLNEDNSLVRESLFGFLQTLSSPGQSDEKYATSRRKGQLPNEEAELVLTRDILKKKKHFLNNLNLPESTETQDHADHKKQSERKEKKVGKKRRSSISEDTSNKSQTATKSIISSKCDEEIELTKDTSSKKRKHFLKQINQCLSSNNQEGEEGVDNSKCSAKKEMKIKKKNRSMVADLSNELQSKKTKQKSKISTLNGKEEIALSKDTSNKKKRYSLDKLNQCEPNENQEEGVDDVKHSAKKEKKIGKKRRSSLINESQIEKEQEFKCSNSNKEELLSKEEDVSHKKKKHSKVKKNADSSLITTENSEECEVTEKKKVKKQLNEHNPLIREKLPECLENLSSPIQNGDNNEKEGKVKRYKKKHEEHNSKFESNVSDVPTEIKKHRKKKNMDVEEP